MARRPNAVNPSMAAANRPAPAAARHCRNRRHL